MRHEELRERLYDLYDRELPVPELRELEAHLGACAECRASLEEWRRIAGALFAAPAPAPSEALVQRIMRGLPGHEESAPTPAWTLRWLAPAFSLALAGLAILAWPDGNGVSAETLILAGGEEGPSLAAFSPQAPKPDDLLGLILEEP